MGEDAGYVKVRERGGDRDWVWLMGRGLGEER